MLKSSRASFSLFLIKEDSPHTLSKLDPVESLMPNTPEQTIVNQVAKLARIHLDEQQAESSGKKLEQILGFVSQLEQVELPEDVTPFFGAIESVNAIREDQLQTSVPREKILDNAPESDGEFYLVPPVF